MKIFRNLPNEWFKAAVGIKETYPKCAYLELAPWDMDYDEKLINDGEVIRRIFRDLMSFEKSYVDKSVLYKLSARLKNQLNNFISIQFKPCWLKDRDDILRLGKSGDILQAAQSSDNFPGNK